MVPLLGIKRECGADEMSYAAAAPATVSGELVAKYPLGKPGKAGVKRRPASQETCHYRAADRASTEPFGAASGVIAPKM